VARLAIIIPHLGSPKLLEETLVSVLSNRPDDCEVVVVLGRDYDNPYELDGEVQFVQMPGRPGWVESLDAGIAATRAPIVHWLASGTEVAEGWADAAMAHFDDRRVAAVAPLVLDQQHPDRVIAAGMTYHPGGMVRPLARGKSAADFSDQPEQSSCDRRPGRPRSVLAPHPAAAFYRRSVLETVGPMDRQTGDRFAGVDLGLMLRQLGLRTVLEPQSRVTVRPEATFRRGHFRDAMESEQLFWRWAGTTGLARSLLLHGVLLTGESVGGLWNLSFIPRWAGRLVGACLALGHRGSVSRRMAELRPSLATPSPESTIKPPHFSLTSNRSMTRDREVA
jgi:GT2 family glycosyltransferase